MSFTRKTSYVKKTSPLSTEISTRSVVTAERKRTISEYCNSRPIAPVVVETRAVIQKEEWLEAARRSTERFKRHGSAVPLVWVLTEGNQIPDNAVPFGEDRSGGTLYVARALLEGSLHIGKAGFQFAGAVIGYAGKEHIVNNYEVLVCASQLRWGFARPEPEGVLSQGTVVLAKQRGSRSSRRTEVEFNTTLVESDIARFISEDYNIPLDREAGLRRLADIKTVIVIDDSLSMQEGNLWKQAQEALGGIVEIANQYGSKGCDIHFMHTDDYAQNMQSKTEVQALFNRVSPDGACEDTPTGAKLGQIINHYLPFVEHERSTHEPITVVVITDGLPTDQADLERVIVDAAHRLDRRHVKHDRFGIQFVQIGTDPAASELLHTLDDHLVNRYRIRDMVDSTPFDPAQGAFDTEYMLKILLGGLLQRVDRVGSALSSPAVGRANDRSPHSLAAKLGHNSPRLATLSPRSGLRAV